MGNNSSLIGKIYFYYFDQLKIRFSYPKYSIAWNTSSPGSPRKIKLLSVARIISCSSEILLNTCYCLHVPESTLNF